MSTCPQSRSLEAESGKRGVKRVRFTAEAVILNAALGGELEVLKQCIREVTSNQASVLSYLLSVLQFQLFLKHFACQPVCMMVL